MRKMQEENLKKMFEQEITIHPVEKTRSLYILKEAAAEKIISCQIRKADVIKNQLRFFDYKLLLTQVIGILCALVLFTILKKNGGHEEEYIAVGSCFAALFGLFAPLACSKDYTSNLAELADSCYFNIPLSCALKMAVFGGVDLLMLLFLLLIASGNVQKSMFEVGVYFLVPFLISCCMYFCILMTGGTRHNNYLLIGFCILFCAASASLSIFPYVYEKAAFTLWLLILPAAVILLCGEIIYFMHQMEKGEILCTN